MSPWQWLIIFLIGIVGAVVLWSIFWRVFVNPAPPDFSGLLDPTQGPPTATHTATPAPTATPAATATELPAILATAPTALPTETATPPITAQVDDNGIGLNMRAGPDPTQPIVARLLPLTPLTVLGRNADSTWLFVTNGTAQGWVVVDFVTLSGGLGDVPLVTATPTDSAPASVTDSPASTPTGDAPTLTPLPPSPVDSGDYPYILGVSPHAHEIFLAGQQQGNRPDVFSKVGDSITATDNFLIPVGNGQYDLSDYGYLKPVIDYFTATEARHGNSFVNDSLSANPGWASWTPINFHATHDPVCTEGELPIACELRVVKPSIVLIMLGTNDIDDSNISPAIYERQMRQIIEICINAGVIPLVSTIPNYHRDTAPRGLVFNDILIKLTTEYDIPLWDYHAALQNLPNDGLSSDGVHPSVSPNGPASFTADSLQYGYNVRNLTALQALDALWREVIRQ